MVAYNNNDILMVPYEDLPDGDKYVISKAIEEFQNKCLLSYTKTRDNKILQNYPLPRFMLHGQIDVDEACRGPDIRVPNGVELINTGRRHYRSNENTTVPLARTTEDQFCLA